MITRTIHTRNQDYPVAIMPVYANGTEELSYGVKMMGESFMMRYSFDYGRFYPALPVPIDEKIIEELSDIIDGLEE